MGVGAPPEPSTPLFGYMESTTLLTFPRAFLQFGTPAPSSETASVSNLHIPIRPPGPEAKRGTRAFGCLPRWLASNAGLYRCGPAARRWGQHSRDPTAQLLTSSWGRAGC